VAKYKVTPTAESIPYDDNGNTISLQEALDDVKLELDSVVAGESAYSYHKIDINVNVTIKNNQHMITTSLELDGFLDVTGGLVML
jgi:hypothetical protein